MYLHLNSHIIAGKAKGQCWGVFPLPAETASRETAGRPRSRTGLDLRSTNWKSEPLIWPLDLFGLAFSVGPII